MRKKIIDKRIFPGSHIAQLPSWARPGALLIRNLFNRRIEYRFISDGIASAHNMAFIENVKFKKAYGTAIEFGGFDYDIPLRVHQACWVASTVVNSRKDAIFVELGTGKGFVMSSVLTFLNESNVNYRNVYLFDTFKPNSLDDNGEQADLGAKNVYYADNMEAVQNNFAAFKNVNLIDGILPNSLIQFDLPYVDFLHVDLNNSKIERLCLEYLWDKIRPGGYVLVDDYAYSAYIDTSIMVNDFFDGKAPVLTFASGQGLIQKPFNCTREEL